MRADNWQPSDQAWVNANREDARGYERTESQIDYEILRDTLIAAFNPPDEDAAEPAVMTSAIDRAWALIVAQPCHCEPPDSTWLEDIEPCERCNVLGRVADTELER